MSGEGSGPEAGPQSKNRATLRPEIIGDRRRRQWEWQPRPGPAVDQRNRLWAGESRRCSGGQRLAPRAFQGAEKRKAYSAPRGATVAAGSTTTRRGLPGLAGGVDSKWGTPGE